MDRLHCKLALTAALLLIFAPRAGAYYTEGIIDRAGNIIAPCDFHRIECVGNKFFYLEEMDSENPLKCSYRGHIVDRNGQEIKVSIPDGCTLSKLFLPETSSGENKPGLPEGSILEVHGPHGFGLYRPNGTTLLEPKYDAIGEPNKEYYPVLSGNPFSRTTLLFTLNSKTGERVNAPPAVDMNNFTQDEIFPFQVNPGGGGNWGYMARNGKVILTPRFKTAGKFSENWLACVSSDRDTYFYIDKAGKVLSPNYTFAGSFSAKRRS
jgi:hypothetical protein